MIEVRGLRTTYGTTVAVDSVDLTVAEGEVVGLLGAAVRGLDAAALGDWPDPMHLVVLIAWTVGLSALAARCFRWESPTPADLRFRTSRCT